MPELPENYEVTLERLDDKQKTSPMRFQSDRERILAILKDTDENGYREMYGQDWTNLDFRRLMHDLKKRMQVRAEERKKLQESLDQ